MIQSSVRSDRGRRILIGLSVLATIAGCSTDKSVGTSRPTNHLIAFTEQSVPPLSVPNYKTSGSFPQASAPGKDLSKANSAIRHAIDADEMHYAIDARQEEQQSGTSTLDPNVGPGDYEVVPSANLMSATASALSMLLPVTRLYPGGNDGDSWLAITVYTANGEPITITDLLANGLETLPAVATLFKAQLLAANSCIAAAQRDPQLGGDFADGFAPTESNYQYFALTAHGLAVGFPVGQVSFPACGRADAVVPYADLTPYLSSLGRRLATQVQTTG